MRSYHDLNSFLEWSSEEKDQFTTNVIKGLIMDGVDNSRNS